MKRSVMALAALTMTACAAQQADKVEEDFVTDERPMGETHVYECTGMNFMTRIGPGEMALWLDDRYLVLSQVRAASGTKYVEGDVTFWSKGHDVMLEVDGQRFSDCKLNRARVPWEDARRRGVSFRAVGNEPGWVVEVRDARNILFKGDYGATVLLFTDPVMTSEEEGVRQYSAQTAGHKLRLHIDDAFCRDSMADIEYPATVTLEVDGRSYRGCGRDLDYPWE